MSGPDNYDDVLGQLQSAGLQVDVIESGRLMRCKDEHDRGSMAGWYAVHEVPTQSGALVLVGAYGSWRGRWSKRVELSKTSMSDDERAAIRARIKADRKQAEARRRGLAERAARRALHSWRQCAEQGTSPYLERKGVAGHGVRYSPRNAVVIPVIDGKGEIHGLQLIHASKRNGRDKEFYPPGMSKRGYWHQIGMPTSVLLVVEGYATGASVHEATGLPVAVAFDAGNLLPVAQALRKRHGPALQIIICADDDFLTDGNPGITAATNAALAVSGTWLAPVFADRGTRKLTDFNDLHQAEGLHVVRAQITAHLEANSNSKPVARAHDATGERGKGTWHFSIDDLLNDFTLVYGTETVFDGQRRRILPMGALRAAAGRDKVRSWLEHPDRKIVLAEAVVFDPAAYPDDEGICNLYGGWPTQPAAGQCDELLGLLEYLCSREDNPLEVYSWLLKWLAYPIQHPGAKMQTSLLMHGPEGTGKNTFFGAIRALYGEYGGIFSQTELESQFNGWASRRLFMIGNEVVTRAELYQQQGRLKNMITEPEWQLNEKNMPARLEANRCNFVFFSNRLDIAKLDAEDRRYCVIWTPGASEIHQYDAVHNEIKNGGIAALHQYLLDLDLADFSPHTRPPMTRSKRELIEMGMDSTDRFWSRWKNGDLPVPWCSCRSQDLYSAYRIWAHLEGVPRPAPQYTLLGMVTKRPGVIRQRKRRYVGQTQRQFTIITPPDATDGDFGDAVEAFQFSVDDWRQEAKP